MEATCPKQLTDEHWITIVNMLNIGKIDDAKMLYLETNHNMEGWESSALLAYIFAREKYDANDALKILQKFKMPEAPNKNELPAIIIYTEFAILHGIIAANSFGNIKRLHLKKAEQYLGEIELENSSRLPLIQNLQINRTIADILYNYGNLEKSLEISLTTKEKWETISDGIITFSQDIPYLLNLIEKIKVKALEQKLEKISSNSNSHKNTETESILPNATVRLDFSRYIEKTKEEKQYMPCNELWSEIAGNQHYTGATIKTSDKNKMSYSMLDKLRLESADLNVLTHEYNDGIPRLPIIIEKRTTLAGDFVVTDEIASDIEINPYLSATINK